MFYIQTTLICRRLKSASPLAVAFALVLDVAQAHAQDATVAPGSGSPAAATAPQVDAPAREPDAPPPAAPPPATSIELAPASTTPAAPPLAAEVPPAPAPVPVDAPPPPPAGPGWSPVFTGTFLTRYEMRKNYQEMGVSRARFLEGDATFYRARFGIGTGLIDIGKGLKVGLQFTPQATGVFGAMGPNTVADAALGLHEGYSRVQGQYVRVDAGRFEMNYGDAFIIGNLDWHELGRSFDGARARFSSSPSSAWIDLFVTMVDEGRDPALTGAAAKGLGIGKGDLYFYGAYAALGPALMPNFDLDLYALAQGYHKTPGLKADASDSMSPTYTREAATQVTLGARVKQKIKFLDYRAEVGLQKGSRPGAAPQVMPNVTPATKQAAVDVSAYQVDAEVGLNLMEDKLRVAAEGMYASGDDAKTKKNEGWDELYPTAHKFLGLADVFHQKGMKRTNVTSAVLHVTLKPMKDLVVQADGHLFSRPEKVGNVKGRAGAELDVGAAYAIGKGLKLRALYAAFFPDKDFYPLAPATGPVDPIHYAEVELRYDLAP